MNPFEKINELKKVLQQEVKSKNIQPTDTISCMEHYQRMLSLLAMVEHELMDAEYNYVISALDNSVIKTFDKVTVKQEQLAEGLLVFTPLVVDDEELGSIDMGSLYDILSQLRDSGKIKEDMLVLPPYVNAVRARLAMPGEEVESDSEEAINAYKEINEDEKEEDARYIDSNGNVIDKNGRVVLRYNDMLSDDDGDPDSELMDSSDF